MSYLVLARKYRPQTFEEIVGQEHVTRALQNAIRLDRVAHSFLFTGARGVGKTSAARVLTKALQCESGPTETPCGTCRACTEIVSGSAVDVFEIDGASNRGINEIRELRDGVAYAPARDRYKIYIIDEVHMLTSEAFNALLKTLEEPPSHVKFIFATTEPQKIPVTILSRCQRYDFKRVPLAQVKRHLMSVLEQEGVTIAEEGLRMVARESEGSVRDSLSLMDRVISFAGLEADAKMVADCLGIADRKWLIQLVRGVLTGDTPTALSVLADVHHYGYDMRAFSSDILNTVRDLMVVKVCGVDARAAELSDAEAKALAQLGEPYSVAALQRIFQILLKAADAVASSRHPRLVLEMAVIRAALARDMQSVPEVLARLEALESRLAQGLPTGGSAGGPSRQAQSAHAPAAPRPPETGRQAPHRQAPPPPREARMPEPAAPRPAESARSPRARRPEPPPHEGPEEGAPGGYDSPAPDYEATAMLPAARFDPAAWPEFVTRLTASDPLLASVLERARVERVEGRRITLGVGVEFYRKQLEAGSSRERLLELLREGYGVTEVVVQEAHDESGTIAKEIEAHRMRESAVRRARIEAHPVTQAVQELMAGTLVDIQVEESGGGDVKR